MKQSILIINTILILTLLSPLVAKELQKTHATNPWEDQFISAKKMLKKGLFSQAADNFKLLIKSSKNISQKEKAELLYGLSKEWALSNFVFVKQKEIGEGNKSFKATNYRTTGEIAALYLGSLGFGIYSGGPWLGSFIN